MKQQTSNTSSNTSLAISLPIGLSAVFVGLTVFVLVVALVPTFILWNYSISKLGNSANTTAEELILYYRKLLLSKAESFVTTKLREPVLITRAFAKQIQNNPSVLQGNCNDSESFFHTLMPSEDEIFGVTSLNLAWKNERGYHLWTSRFGNDRTFAVFDTQSPNISNNVFNFYYYDDFGTPNRSRIVKYVESYDIEQREWWVSRTNGIDGYHWTTTRQSILAGDGPMVIISKCIHENSADAIAMTAVTFKKLTTFFSGLNLTSNGRAFLIDDAFVIVAATPPYSVQDSKGNPINSTQSSDFDVKNVTNYWLEFGRKSSFIILSSESKVFIVDVEKIHIQEGNFNWLLFVLTPPSDFLQDFSNTTNEIWKKSSLLLSIVIISEVISLVFIFIVCFSIALHIKKFCEHIIKHLKQASKLNRSHSGSCTTNEVLLEIRENETSPMWTSFTELNAVEESANQMRKAITEFRRFVPEFVERSANFGLEKTSGTVLYLNVANVLYAIDRHGVAEVSNGLHDIFEIFATIVVNNEGVIDKFFGDSLIALFGVSNTILQPEKKACKAAQEIIIGLTTQNEIAKQKYNDQIRIRIGLDCGVLFAGNVGSNNRVNYTVIGEAIQNASRLEPLNKEFLTSACALDEFRKVTEDEYMWRCLCLVQLKANQQQSQSESHSTYQRVHEFLGKWTKLTTEQVNLIRDYTKIDNCWKNGDFKTAVTLMKEYSQLHPNDSVIVNVLQRTNEDGIAD